MFQALCQGQRDKTDAITSLGECLFTRPGNQLWHNPSNNQHLKPHWFQVISEFTFISKNRQYPFEIFVEKPGKSCMFHTTMPRARQHFTADVYPQCRKSCQCVCSLCGLGLGSVILNTQGFSALPEAMGQPPWAPTASLTEESLLAPNLPQPSHFKRQTSLVDWQAWLSALPSNCFYPVLTCVLCLCLTVPFDCRPFEGHLLDTEFLVSGWCLNSICNLIE